jgi:two-component system sensor histidine kinase ChvG
VREPVRVPPAPRVKRGLLLAARRALGRIGLRLLVVNLLVVLVPVAGLEFARLYERQLLSALERDMRNQAVLIRRLLEVDRQNAIAVGTSSQQEVLRQAAADTRTRVRVLAREGRVLLDSHRDGAPEGPEPHVPSLIPGSSVLAPGSLTSGRYRAEAGDFSAQWSDAHDETWPALAERVEVRRALAGERASFTRVRERSPEVLLFVAEPVFEERRVIAVVYVVRSTQPVLLDLYRIRRGLISVLSIAVVFTVLISLALGWTISRPLARLSRAAKRITRGDRDVPVPIVGSGEIRELSESFASMTRELDGRLRYISDFAADVAHEFKSPLTSIRGAAELLGEGAADDPEARQRFLHNIELDVQRLDRLVSRLLELSRIEASQEPKVERDLLALVTDVARRASTPDHAVTVHAELPGPLRVAVRETDLVTALLNLCDNAVRFSPPGRDVEVHLAASSHHASVTVRDRGPGVPAAHRERVFERFFTTDAERDGTGLGLAIASAVALAHGGRLTLEDPPAEPPGPWGACFQLTLARGPREA